jgi:hypothetical protein
MKNVAVNVGRYVWARGWKLAKYLNLHHVKIEKWKHIVDVLVAGCNKLFDQQDLIKWAKNWGLENIQRNWGI